MAGQHPDDPTPAPRRDGEDTPESMLRGSLRGIALVTAATAGVAAAAAVIALVVSLLYS